MLRCIRNVGCRFSIAKFRSPHIGSLSVFVYHDSGQQWGARVWWTATYTRGPVSNIGKNRKSPPLSFEPGRVSTEAIY